MLQGVHLTENDSLYIYNYQFKKIQKLPLNTLKAVAYLSPYTSEGDEIDQDSYMVGFQIDTQKDLNIFDQYENAVAYFGNKNPFVENKMKLIEWKKAGSDISKKYFNHSKLKPGNTYQAQYDNLTYYLQDYLEENMVQERKLVVINDRLEKVFEKTVTTAGSDGAEFSPLNGENGEESNKYQWTGSLFKGKPPVIFGFMVQSFGCPSITFLDKKEKDLTINCDNRH